jgi:hypothetical protein
MFGSDGMETNVRNLTVVMVLLTAFIIALFAYGFYAESHPNLANNVNSFFYGPIAVPLVVAICWGFGIAGILSKSVVTLPGAWGAWTNINKNEHQRLYWSTIIIWFVLGLIAIGLGIALHQI